MAAGEKAGSKLGKVVDLADNPLVFAFAMPLLIIPMMALLTALFAWLGWDGPRALVQTP